MSDVLQTITPQGEHGRRHRSADVRMMFDMLWSTVATAGGMPAEKLFLECCPELMEALEAYGELLERLERSEESSSATNVRNAG